MTKSNHQLTGYRRGSDLALGYLAAIFSILGLAQVFFAGSREFDLHTTSGHILATLAIVIFILALVARSSKLTVVAALILALLAGGASSALVGSDYQWAGGLHALVGVVSLAIAGSLSSRVFRRSTK